MSRLPALRPVSQRSAWWPVVFLMAAVAVGPIDVAFAQDGPGQTPTGAVQPVRESAPAAARPDDEPATRTTVTPIGPVTVKEVRPGQQPAKGPPPTGISFWQVLLAIGVLVGPFVVGAYLARWLRMREYAFRVSLVLLGVSVASATNFFGWPPKLGIDLRGGVILIYRVSDDQQLESFDMGMLVSAITRRINPEGLLEVTVRPYGAREIEIIIPEADEDELSRIKNIISQSGTLEFRILANRHDHESIINRALADADSPTAVRRKEVYEVASDGRRVPIARWVPVAREEVLRFDDPTRHVIRTVEEREGPVLEILVVIDQQHVTGDYLRSATKGVDDRGRPCVDFMFNARGGTLFGQLTAANLPDRVQGAQRFERQLGIILDGRLRSAPAIQSVIQERGQITGDFTDEQVTDLAAILRAGQLPATLDKEPTTALLIGPTLGEDTIRKGITAMAISVVGVIVFMLFYYRFSGIVANAAVVLNVALTVGFMILLNARFTLAGLAGLALTVGMAVDANVLIYERIREELARGATLRMAIRNGFERATTTIIDANVTTLITAVVLYVIGTDQIKGFATTLILGILMNLYTAITCSRTVFEIAERKRWIGQLKMMSILSGTSFDFLGKTRIAAAASVALIALGLVGVVARGRDLLDIDFTGGVSVEVLFDHEHLQRIGDVRKALESDPRLPGVTVSSAGYEGDPDGLRFKVDTSQPDLAVVEQVLQEKFGEKLAHNRMAVDKLAPIPGKSASDARQPDEKTGAARQGAPGAWEVDDRLMAFAPEAAEAAEAASQAASPSDAAASPETAPTAADEAKDEGAAAAGQKPANEQPPPDKTSPDEDKPSPAGKLPSDDAPKTDDTVPAAEEPAAASDPYAGGTLAELSFSVRINAVTLESHLNRLLQADEQTASVPYSLTIPIEAQTGEQRATRWNLKIALPEAQTRKLLDEMIKSLAAAPMLPSSSEIGPSVAANTQQQAFYALLASLMLILAYVWFRFQQVAFGLAAILALVHDVLIMLGALALSYWLAPVLGFALVEPFKINLPIVAAFLTIIGYSLNDTIVIFDRIREIRGKSPHITAELINTSINQTLSRTLLTSLTVFIVVLTLYAVGGAGIHGFAFALVVGTLSGVYSTIYVASPAVLWLAQTRSQGPGKAVATKPLSQAPAAG